MLMVMLSAISVGVSVKTTLRNNYYTQLANEAAESGLVMAEACLGGNVITWTDATPLGPNTDCSGTIRPECTSATPADTCYILKDATIHSTFSVKAPSLTANGGFDVLSTGTIEQIRASNSIIWKTYSSNSKALLMLSGGPWLSIAPSRTNHTCGIASNKLAYCWGYGVSGRLGNGSTANSNVPVPVDTSGVLSGKTIKAISVGHSHACVIASDDKAYCWGYNLYGELGNGTTTNSNIPVAVNTSGALAGKTIKAISAGWYHTCVIASDDKAYCWGINTNGQLGTGSVSTLLNPGITTPTAVSTSGVLSGKGIKAISAAYYSTCVIASDDKAYCWGENNYGQLGRGNTTDSASPVAVLTTGALSGKTIKAIDTATQHACVIASDDLPYCWGSNNSGQLGNGTTNDASAPVAVVTSGALSGKTAKSISTSSSVTSMIGSDNLLYGWGQDNNLFLAGSTTPVVVSSTGPMSGKTVRLVENGTTHACVIASDGNAYCWGKNDAGQLGNGSSSIASATPVLVITPSGTSTSTNTVLY